MEFITEELQEYLSAYSGSEPPLLQQLNRETNQKVLQPRMLSGHYQGRILSMISKIVSPLQILEIGTYTGYSAICLAEGLRKNGCLNTIDVNEELVEIQRKYFEQSGYGNQIVQHLGNAVDIIPTIETQFDLVFIDADKKQYPDYLSVVLPKLNPGAVILSDNVLWNGKVLNETEKDDLETQSVKKYNEMLNSNDAIETVLLPIRDGLSISRKKK